MKTEDFDAFRDGVVEVMSFYERSVSRFALDAWWYALRAYDLPAVIEAFNRYVSVPDQSCRFPPKPGDIVRLIKGSDQDQALIAWSKVDRALRSVGTYRSVVFDDPTIHRVLHEMGGWVGLGQKDEKEWPFIANEFSTRYRAYASRVDRPSCKPVLIGIADAYNEAKGLPTDQPALIGDKVKAMAVMHSGQQDALPGHASTLRLVGGVDVT